MLYVLFQPLALFLNSFEIAKKKKPERLARK